MIGSVEVTGIDSLIKKLDFLGGDSSTVIDTGLRQGAEKIRSDAVRLVPVKTGHLRRSITVEKIPKGYAVGTNVNYAPYIEFGTGTKGDPKVPHTARTSWRYQREDGTWCTTHGMTAHPFMQPAFENNKQAVVNLVRNQLRLAIRNKMTG